MKLIFMGTPDFSVSILAALLDAGHQVVAVYSQPPRPAGRGHKEQPTPVHAFAAARGIEVRCPKSLKGADEQQAFAALGADAAVVAAYGLILPKPILEAPRLGCFNVHASLLPRWRGAAPIQRAIQAGDVASGVTIMQMDEGLDTGAMLMFETVAIGPDTTAATLHDELAAMGARLMVAALAAAAAGTLVPVCQPAEGVTYAAKLGKDEGRLDWTRPAAELERQVRALTPWPGVWCMIGPERLKVLKAAVEGGTGSPGTALDDRLLVACGEGALRLLVVQRPGKAPMAAADCLRGFAVPKGAVLA
ncbi:MAG: methionyl-tRNA formyltransferase [Actinomycetota bacterium]